MDKMREAFERGIVTTDHGLEWRCSTLDGYGEVNWTENGIRMRSRAHRVAWILVNGYVDSDIHIDHLPTCPKSCVTVEHLQALTPSEHMKLGWKRGEIGGWEKGERYNITTKKACKLCNEMFTPNSGRQLFCSPLCNSRSKEEKRKGVRYPRPSSKICAWCSTEFAPKRIDSRFCSRKCIYDDQNNTTKIRKQGEV